MASHGVSRVAGAGAGSPEARQKELEQIAVYKGLVDLVNTRAAERQYTIEVLGLITKLLKRNPEYYTIWNHRRRVLGALLDTTSTDESLTSKAGGGEALIDGELHLTYTLLREYPKCYWIWNHRNWVLRKGESLSDTKAARKLWSGELQLVGKMLHVDSRNFHAWSYRRHVVAHLERIPTSLPPSTSNPSESLTESEYAYTTKMIKTNLSNFSAWHNRAKLIPHLLNERGADNEARRDLFDSELALICTAINTDPFDQSIWYYHQYLMSTLSPECPEQGQIVLQLSNMDRQRYYAHEMEYIQEITEDEANCKWIYVALLDLAASYLETDAGTNAFKTVDIRSWLEQLRRLDPLRKGRWEELGSRLNV